MRHKLLTLILAVAVIASLVLAGCAKPAPTAPVTPKAEVITWKIQCSNAASHPAYIYLSKLCDAVTKASGGQLVFKSFTGGSIVPATKEVVQGVSKGVIEASYACPGYSLDTWPAAGLFGSRPTQMNADAFRAWFTVGGGVEFMNKMMEGYNVHALPAVQTDPPEIWMMSGVPIKSLDDLKGLKVRCMGDGGEILGRMGATVIFLPGGEVYESMERGVIDAFEFANPAVNWDMGFQEITKYVYFSETRAPIETLMFVVNNDAWEELPADLKQLVEDEVSAWTVRASIDIMVGSVKAIDKFKDYGCIVERIPDDVDQALFVEAQKFYGEKASKEAPIYGEILESQRAFMKTYVEYNTLNASHVA